MSDLQQTASQALARTPSAYWRETTRPLVSLAFVSPILLAYELGLVALGPQAMRNGADAWLRYWLQTMGFSQYFLLPLLTCSVLLGWHYIKRQRWRVDFWVLWGMLVESVIFGSLLVVLAKLQSRLFGSQDWFTSIADSAGQMIAFFGAGIYEELLFRLLLIPLLAMLLRGSGISCRTSVILAIVLSSLLFSAAHYRFHVTFAAAGDPFEWISFLFRFTAGIFFSVLLIYRGFGVTVATHALYDIFVSFL